MSQKQKIEDALKLFDRDWPEEIKPVFGLPVVVRGGSWGTAKNKVEFGFLENPTITDDVWRVRIWQVNGKARSFLASLDRMRPQFKNQEGLDQSGTIVQTGGGDK